MRITKQYFNSLFSSKLFLIRAFHSQLSNKITGQIIFIILHFLFGNFPYIS